MRKTTFLIFIHETLMMLLMLINVMEPDVTEYLLAAILIDHSVVITSSMFVRVIHSQLNISKCL